MTLPEHMTVWGRNQRIFESLLSTGLYVEAVPCKDDQSKIDHIIVSAAPPVERLALPEKSAQNASPAGIGSGMEGTPIRGDIQPPASQRDNVIDLPSVS